jgi:hypothetical protein
VHYEDLIAAPRETLEKLGAFLEHDLDHDRILKSGLGRLSESNSSFRKETKEPKVNPLGRWKQRLSRANVAAIEAAVGDCLEQTGYFLSLPEAERKLGTRELFQRALYGRYLSAKTWLKQTTPAGRLVSLSVLELESGPKAGAQSAPL